MANSTEESTQEPAYTPAKQVGDGSADSLKPKAAASELTAMTSELQKDLRSDVHQGDSQSTNSRHTDFSSDHLVSKPGRSAEIEATNLEHAQSRASGSSVSFVPSESDRTVVNASPIAEAQDFYPTGSVASLARVLVGQQLDHYHLIELVGGGGMGAVFKASDTRLDRIVAVKVIPNLGRDQESLKRFRVEAQSAAKLDHPNIARVYYVGETSAWSYIVFEFVEGVNLRDLVSRNAPISIDESIYYTIQIAQALQHASERAVVHRDIKPSNALVTSSDLVKVVDMGLARTTSLDQSTNDLTASGVTLGTFDYISPEQARDPRAADVRSDLYSLGCTLYYLLTGRPPYYQGTAIQKLLMHGETPPEDPRHFRDDIPTELLSVIRKLMSKRPRDRYQQPIDLISDLQSIARLYELPKSQTGSSPAATLPLPSSRWIQEMFPWIVSLAVLLVSSGYLYRQHLNSIGFAIPLEIITEYSPDGDSSRMQNGKPRKTSADPPQTNAPSRNPQFDPPGGVPAKRSTMSVDPNPMPMKALASNEISSFETGEETISSTDSINRSITPDTPETLSPDKVSAEEFIAQPNYSNTATSPAELSDRNNKQWDDELSSKIVLPSTSYSTSDSDSISFSTKAERLNGNDPKLNMIGAQRSGIKVATAPPNIVVVREKAPTDEQIESFSSIVDPPVLTSLQEAIQVANSNLQVNEIWLYDDQLIVEKPIPITAPHLTIRSKGSQRCRIEWSFQSSSITELGSTASSPTQFTDNQEFIPTKAMFELFNSRVSLQDVDLQVLPPEVGRGNLAVVSLAAGSQIKLSNSVVTLLPRNGDWNVSFAFIESKPVNDPPQVELKDTIVRGAGSLIRMEAGTRSELRWANGLLAVDGWLLETKGAAVASKTPQTVRMDLQDLTIDTKLGLAKVNLTSKEPYPLCVSRDAENCTFISSPDSPMISIEGVSWKDSSELEAILPSWIDLRGADNAYDEQINTIVQLQGSSGRTKQIGFEASSMGIFSDRAPETIVPWSNSIDPNKPFYQRIPNDYMQETSTSFRSGMRIDAIPSLQ